MFARMDASGTQTVKLSKWESSGVCCFCFFFFRMAQGSWGPHLCSPFEVLQMLQLVGASEKEIF